MPAPIDVDTRARAVGSALVHGNTPVARTVSVDEKSIRNWRRADEQSTHPDDVEFHARFRRKRQEIAHQTLEELASDWQLVRMECLRRLSDGEREKLTVSDLRQLAVALAITTDKAHLLTGDLRPGRFGVQMHYSERSERPNLDVGHLIEGQAKASDSG